MSYFKFNNKKIYFKITGSGDPLLLVHGNTLSSKMFLPVIKMFAKEFKTIVIDLPGHGKSERLERFETDFWFNNALACNALLEELDLDNVSVIGTSGGALTGINLCLEFPERIRYLVADSFEGEYPLDTYIDSIEEDRNRDKKKFLAKLIWFYCHGRDWRKIVDMDTEVNIEFSKSGNSFFHKSITALKIPTLITGSLKDEYCDHLDIIYSGLQKKNQDLSVHIFESGGHPAMLSNKNDFFKLVVDRIKDC